MAHRYKPHLTMDDIEYLHDMALELVLMGAIDGDTAEKLFARVDAMRALRKEIEDGT